MIFVPVYFRALKRKPVICKSDGELRFSHFLVLSQQRNQRKSFDCHGKYYPKENFRAPAWTWQNYTEGTKQAISSGQGHSILPAQAVNHSTGFGSSYPLAELAI